MEPLPNTMDIVADSKGVLVYQEHAMRIAQRVAGFDDNQADSFLRKAMAKKKRDLLDLCNQWLIYGKINEEAPAGYDADNKEQPHYDPSGKYGSPIKGGINNGYTVKELKDYIEMTEAFCSYLFNKSHASCYSFISTCTMYLKTFYRTEFMAALLSLQTTQEKIDLYCKIANGYGIEVTTPDINLSNENFTAVDGKILYGLGSIKGVGATAIPTLIANRPYADIADAYEKAGKKAFNKKIGESLIKAGAFDFLDTNRNSLLNTFQDVRKAKKEERYDEVNYSEDVCTEYEQAVLGSAITYKPYWDTVVAGEVVSVELELKNVREKRDKNGNMMAFIDVVVNKCPLKGVVFASTYCKNVDAFDMQLNDRVYAKIKKDDKGGFVVNSIIKNLPPKNNVQANITNHMIADFDKLMEKVVG